MVQLRAIRTTSQAATLLRSGQVSFVDIAPAQTLKEQLALLGDVRTVNVNPARQLRLNLSTESEVLSTPQLRRTLLSLIDSDQVARLATERTTDLRVPDAGIRCWAQLARKTSLHWLRIVRIIRCALQ